MSRTKCINGCDFFGDPQHGLCSGCYKKLLIASGQMKAPEKPAEGKQATTTRQLTAYGVEIHVRLGDLTTETVDAIVNAANDSLIHASGLAGAIVKKGGDVIKEESKKYVKEKGRLDEGQVATTSAGRLPCKHVIHCVGPMWHDGKKGEPLLLDMSMRSVLDESTRLQITSVAVPALSSGIFGFPKNSCAHILWEATTNWLKENEGKTTLKQVYFTNFDKETVTYFEKEYDNIWNKQFPPTSSTSSSTVSTSTSSMTSTSTTSTTSTSTTSTTSTTTTTSSS